MPLPALALGWSFLTSPIGKYVLIGVAVLSSIAYIDRKATYRERARCQAAVLQSKLDAQNADLAAARQAEEAARRAAEELGEEKRNAEAETEALRKRIAELPVSEQCIIPDRSVRPGATKPSRSNAPANPGVRPGGAGSTR